MSPRFRLVVALTSTLLVGYVAVGSLLSRVLGDSTYGQLAVFNEVVRIVLDAYVEPVNLERAMAGARLGLADALDGDSAYLEAADFRAWQQGPSGEADLGVLLSRRFSFLAVVATRPGSPAEKAGVRAGDILKTIDGRHTRLVPAPVGERLLQGRPGSVVKLTLLRANTDPIDVSVTRERPADAPPQARMLDARTGYLKVPEITARVTGEVRSEVESLRRGGARRLVLDLRSSAFGSPADGVRLAELFVEGGVVARLSGRGVAEQVFNADPGRSVWNLPLVALVDHGTAGPAEVVAAALADSGRAQLVGERTFGRAPLLKPVPLESGGLVLTVARFASPKGTPIHDRGVEPSVKVEAPDADGEPEEQPGEKADPVLEKALELLDAPPAAKAA